MTYDYAVTAFRVVDGDTYYLTLDVGFRITTVIECRLDGWDCPEKRSSAARKVEPYERAAAVTAQHAADNWLVGARNSLRVETQSDPEKYGRWLGTLYDTRTEGFLGLALSARGLAVPYDGTKATPRWHEVYTGPIA